MDPSYQSVSETVARYLVYVTVGLVTLGSAVDVGSIVPTGSLTVVATGTIAVAVGVRHLAYWGEAESAEPTPSLRRPSARAVLAVMLGLLVAGTVLRAYALGAQSFWFDEAISANAAIAVLEDGQPTFPSGYTYWRAFPHTLVMVGSMAVFGTGEAAARLPSIVFGVATIGVTYWLGREVGGSRVGLLAAALVTFASWEIAWSRQARMYQQFQLLYTLALVLLLQVERTWFEDVRAVAVLVVVIVLAGLTHGIGYVLLPVTVAYLGMAGLVDGRLSGRVAGGLLVGSLALVIALEFVTGELFGALGTVATTDVSYWDAYADWLVDEFHAFVYLAVVGAALTFYRGWYRSGAVLVLAVAPPVWLLSFHTELFGTRYLYFAVPVLFLWAAVTIEYIAAVTVEQSRTVGGRFRSEKRTVSRANGGQPTVCFACLVAFGFAAMLALGGGFTGVPQAEYELGTNAPQPEFAGAYEHVNAHREPGDVIVAGWTAPGVYYAGGVDYWLAHNLTGGWGNWTVDGQERYAGAAPIRSADDLESVTEEHDRGWIVVDEIAFARQDPETRAFLLEVQLERDEGGVLVFSWDHTEHEDVP